MNAAAKEVFVAYFGSPDVLYTILAGFLFLVMALAWIIIIIKAFKNRSEDRDKDDVGVLWIVLRGLFLLLLLIAVFMSH